METKQNQHMYHAIDLFCGCGGVSAGLKAAGFSIVAAVDNDADACRTYRQNHPEVKVLEKDLRETVDRVHNIADRTEDEIELITVCAPCQPFSSLNHANDSGAEERLALEAMQVVSAISPSVIVMENVPGMTSDDFGNVREELMDELFQAGYRYRGIERVNVADYGVPQRRRRSILIASREDVQLPTLPKPDTPSGERLTVRDAIENLPSLEAGDCDESDPLHKARDHHNITLRRLKHIPKDGGSRDALPESLVLECHKEYNGYPDVYGRMKWDEVAPTLTTGCTDVTKGRFAHPRDDRAITAREAARLQGFPDSYEFTGNRKSIARQIGNAVPLPFAKRVAKAVVEVL